MFTGIRYSGGQCVQELDIVVVDVVQELDIVVVSVYWN